MLIFKCLCNLCSFMIQLIFSSTTELHTNTLKPSGIYMNHHESSQIIMNPLLAHPNNLHFVVETSVFFFSKGTFHRIFPNGKTRTETDGCRRFCLGQPPSELECYAAALIYAVIYASRWDKNAMQKISLPWGRKTKNISCPGELGKIHWLK